MARRPFAALVATRVLYMEERRGQDPDPCYAREFDARILERGPDFVVLDQTLFYAEGGGQPDDTGTLRWEGGEARVLRVTKEKGVVKHHVDRMPAAEEVHGVIDWDRDTSTCGCTPPNTSCPGSCSEPTERGPSATRSTWTTAAWTSNPRTSRRGI